LNYDKSKKRVRKQSKVLLFTNRLRANVVSGE